MYLFKTDFLLTLLTGQVDDFVAVSHAGHGANSYALSYFLVDGPLALFLQTAWGGVFTDPEKAESTWRLLVSHVERLIQAAQSSYRSQRWRHRGTPGRGQQRFSEEAELGALPAATR